MTDFSADLAANENSIRNLMRAFLASVAIVGGGVVGWAATTKIDSAVIVAGTFSVKSNTQTIQHPEGGVVGAILVHEGQLVSAGEVLIRLDAAKVASDTRIAERHLIELCAQKARLEAERQDSATITMPECPSRPPEAIETLNASIKEQQNFLDEKHPRGPANWRSSESTVRKLKIRSMGLPKNSKPWRNRKCSPRQSSPIAFVG